MLQNASNNANDMISKFSIIYNRTRRKFSTWHFRSIVLTNNIEAVITGELVEVSPGFAFSVGALLTMLDHHGRRGQRGWIGGRVQYQFLAVGMHVLEAFTGPTGLQYLSFAARPDLRLRKLG